ncbi:hypothetical protein FLLO111716_03475 [Flavobacterium longum]
MSGVSFGMALFMYQKLMGTDTSAEKLAGMNTAVTEKLAPVVMVISSVVAVDAPVQWLNIYPGLAMALSFTGMFEK